MLVESNAASSFLPIRSLQAQHYQDTTHSFARQESAIRCDFSSFRTLSIVTGVGYCPKLRLTPQAKSMLREVTTTGSGSQLNQLRCCAHQARHASGWAAMVAPVMSRNAWKTQPRVTSSSVISSVILRSCGTA